MSEAVRRRYLEVNGEHPMTAADDAYVREHFVPADAEVLALIEAGSLPLPSYYLSDGTPMVPRDLRDPVEWAGGLDRLHDWFVSHWDDDQQATAEEEWGEYLDGIYVCLKSVTPVRMQQKTALIEQIKAAVARLEQDPRDSTARGSLGEAVARLEGIELPMSAYDRLRFGGPLSPDVWIHDVRRDHLTPRPPELPIRTSRLVLRRTQPGDAEAMWGYHRDPDVAAYLLEEPWTRRVAEHKVRERTPEPDKLGLVIELDGEVVGDVVLMLQAPSYSVAEIGWVLHPDAAGRGIATEAATALLDLAFGHYGAHRVYAQLDARNERSAALCERLGMQREGTRRRDYWSKGEWTDSFEYAILREDWRPAAD
ncbi:GNAT family N-acetyltransferase [Nocardioides sp. LHG3406-4]|uniref:GNAT family N-acetyltransferase n=1 Tax=Nocardioides sp. LHG3406-4 TaxID=2804575 RepID=UPI003CF1839F